MLNVSKWHKIVEFQKKSTANDNNCRWRYNNNNNNNIAPPGPLHRQMQIIICMKMDKDKAIDIVCMDFSKAIEKVLHGSPLWKGDSAAWK